MSELELTRVEQIKAEHYACEVAARSPRLQELEQASLEPSAALDLTETITIMMVSTEELERDAEG